MCSAGCQAHGREWWEPVRGLSHGVALARKAVKCLELCLGSSGSQAADCRWVGEVSSEVRVWPGGFLIVSFRSHVGLHPEDRFESCPRVQ